MGWPRSLSDFVMRSLARTEPTPTGGGRQTDFFRDSLNRSVPRAFNSLGPRSHRRSGGFIDMPTRLQGSARPARLRPFLILAASLLASQAVADESEGDRIFREKIRPIL